MRSIRRTGKIGLLGLFLVAMPLLAAEPMMAVRVREDGPALTLAQAKSLTPAGLGEALLAPGHPRVSEAKVGPQGQEPPTPPGMPEVTRVTLFLQPVRSRQPGFCDRLVATVYLKPVDRLPDGGLPAAAADHVWTRIAYRWAGTERGAPDCDAPTQDFFIPRPGQERQALDAVRLLASAIRDARRNRRLRFHVSVEDVEGPQRLALQREHPELGLLPLAIVTDADKALAAMPIDAVTSVDAAAGTSLLSASDLIDDKGRPLPAATIFMAGEWTAGLVLDSGKVRLIRLVRDMPPPF